MRKEKENNNPALVFCVVLLHRPEIIPHHHILYCISSPLPFLFFSAQNQYD